MSLVYLINLLHLNCKSVTIKKQQPAMASKPWQVAAFLFVDTLLP